MSTSSYSGAAPRPAARACPLLAAAGCLLLAACGDGPVGRAQAAPPPAPAAVAQPSATAGAPSPRRIISIVPMGKVDRGRLERVAEAVRGAYDADARIEPVRPLPAAAWFERRRRWRAEKLLQAVEAEFPDGAWKAVLVTEAEISTTKGDIEDWGIGGLGIIDGRTCVVSTHIIRKHSRTKAQLDERLRKLAVHELGHTLGLEHCQVFACVMADARGKLIRSLDASMTTFCGRCRKVVARND